LNPDGTRTESPIFAKLDRLSGTLVYAGPAFDAVLETDRGRFLPFHLVDFAGTDLDTVVTAAAFLLVNDRIHI